MTLRVCVVLISSLTRCNIALQIMKIIFRTNSVIDCFLFGTTSSCAKKIKLAAQRISVKIWFHLYYIQNRNLCTKMYTLKSSFKPGQCLHSVKQNTQWSSSVSDKERKSVLAHRNVNIHIHPYLQSDVFYKSMSLIPRQEIAYLTQS